MNNDKVYLKHNVVMEPLINQWYAWPYLLCPATAAMFIVHQHQKLMKSFVAAPQVHVAALKNPAMIGGPFVNYEATRAQKVNELLEKTVKEQAHMTKFAEAIKSLDEMLLNEANGFSLEPLYPKVPEILRGYVELFYDLHNNPSFRFIEALLYQSEFLNQDSQSITLSLAESDDRPFVFSTPRLTNGNTLTLNIPFSHSGLDALSKMKFVPQSLDFIKEAVGVRGEGEELFSSFFTTEPQRQPVAYTGDDVRIRYFGHACILIETAGVSILCDPVISYNYENGIDRYLYSDVPESIDYLLITHNHQDHCMFEPLLQLRHKVKNVIVPKNSGGELADPSLKLILQSVGFKNIYEIDELESIEVNDGAIIGLPFLGEHADLNIRTKIAYLVKLKGTAILCAADSNAIEPKLYERLQGFIGNVDVLFLGMECDGAPMSWLYGPLLTRPLVRKMDQSRRFDGSNYEKGINIVNLMSPAEVYVYAMGQEPWLTYLTSIKYTEESRPIVESNKLVEDCRSRGLVAERLFGQKEITLKAK